MTIFGFCPRCGDPWRLTVHGRVPRHGHQVRGGRHTGGCPQDHPIGTKKGDEAATRCIDRLQQEIDGIAALPPITPKDAYASILADCQEIKAMDLFRRGPTPAERAEWSTPLRLGGYYFRCFNHTAINRELYLMRDDRENTIGAKKRHRERLSLLIADPSYRDQFLADFLDNSSWKKETE